jgi:hypothetical protein
MSWDHLLSAFFEKVCRQAFYPILQNVFASWPLLRLRTAKSFLKWREWESSVSRIFAFSVSFFHIRGQRQMPSSFLVMPISPAYFEQPTSFPHIAFVDCTFRIQLNSLPVKFRQTKFLAFKNRTTDLTS